jgi:NAD(P)-dependent dehydrogenase (short-subunit alcohol dehydrogenase family)
VKVVFLGATRGLGRALARELATRGARIFLLGRSDVGLKRSAADLEVRGAEGPVEFAHSDLLDPAGFEEGLEAADRALGGFDTAILTAGLYGTQEDLETHAEQCHDLLAGNFTNSILWCEAARRRMLSRGGGTLCVYSSVAGLRGRSPVVIYGAAKAGLTRYLEGLDHRFHSKGLRVISVLPGFANTEMTQHLPSPPFAGEPEQVARRVIRAIERGTPQIYAPGIWRAILLAVRSLPRAVMRRLSF